MNEGADVAELILRCVDLQYLESTAIRDRLRDPSLRERIYRSLHESITPSNAPLLRECMREETRLRRLAESEDRFGIFMESIYWCAYLLSRVADVTDVLLMWEAKNINMDTGCGSDSEFFVGAGVGKTIEYLQSLPPESGADVLDYLCKTWADGGPSDLAAWAKWRHEYFMPRPGDPEPGDRLEEVRPKKCQWCGETLGVVEACRKCGARV